MNDMEHSFHDQFNAFVFPVALQLESLFAHPLNAPVPARSFVPERFPVFLVMSAAF